MGISPTDTISGQFDTTNIEIDPEFVEDAGGPTRAKINRCLTLLSEDKRFAEGALIIYVREKRMASILSEFLSERLTIEIEKSCYEGSTILQYHSGMSREERRNAQERFMRGSARIIVATIAFGLGVNKRDIR